jgi:hypothetical protein|tara:strand:- start:397 stop:726 length:330 start_codon:yes stop_codon:yes gene_type:complete
MKTQSAKAKGRKLQQWVRDKLIDLLSIHEEDIESRSMGASGEDLIMAQSARQKFPFSIECKNQERLNIWTSYKQAQENCGKYEPILFVKRNNHKPLVIVDAEKFISIYK